MYTIRVSLGMAFCVAMLPVSAGEAVTRMGLDPGTNAKVNTVMVQQWRLRGGGKDSPMNTQINKSSSTSGSGSSIPGMSGGGKSCQTDIGNVTNQGAGGMGNKENIVVIRGNVLNICK